MVPEGMEYHDDFLWAPLVFTGPISPIIRLFKPIRIIFNGPATIIFWDDGTKTVVKRSQNDVDNKYNAVCAAIAIKLYGSNSAVNKFVKMGTEEK